MATGPLNREIVKSQLSEYSRESLDVYKKETEVEVFHLNDVEKLLISLSLDYPLEKFLDVGKEEAEIFRKLLEEDAKALYLKVLKAIAPLQLKGKEWESDESKALRSFLRQSLLDIMEKFSLFQPTQSWILMVSGMELYNGRRLEVEDDGFGNVVVFITKGKRKRAKTLSDVSSVSLNLSKGLFNVKVSLAISSAPASGVKASQDSLSHYLSEEFVSALVNYARIYMSSKEMENPKAFFDSFFKWFFESYNKISYSHFGKTASLSALVEFNKSGEKRAFFYSFGKGQLYMDGSFHEGLVKPALGEALQIVKRGRTKVPLDVSQYVEFNSLEIKNPEGGFLLLSPGLSEDKGFETLKKFERLRNYKKEKAKAIVKGLNPPQDLAGVFGWF